MSGNGIHRLADILTARGKETFAPRASQHAARVSALVKEASTGIVTGIRATLVEGGAETEVALPKGTGVRAGALITLLGDATDPTQPLRWGQIDYSDDPTAGNSDDADLTPPEWSLPDHVSLLLGALRATLSVYWLGIMGKGVGGYQVSMRRYTDGVAGDWGEPIGLVNHKDTDAIHTANLGDQFIAGEVVDVQIRAFYPFAYSSTGAFSVPNEVRTFTLATDDISPGSASGLAVSTGTPGTLILHAIPGLDLDPAYFKGWVYELATSGSGPTTQTSAPLPGEWTPQGLTPGNYYAAVYPVSHSGVPGGRYPGSGYAGPYAVTGAFSPDITPPPPWLAAPGLTITRNQPATGGETANATVTLPTSPTYTFPSDYKQTRVSFTNGAVFFQRTIPYGQTTLTELVPFGTTSVTIQGEDMAGNLGTASPAASQTLAPTGVPSVAPVVTTESASEAIVVHATAPPSSLRTEVYRATDNLGTGEVLIASFDGTYHVDTFPGIVAGTQYWYRARGINALGNGPYSARVVGTVGAIDGVNLAVNSVRANAFIARMLLADILLTGSDGVAPNPLTAVSRLELRGNTGVNPNQLRAIERIGGVDKLRMLLQGTGLSFYTAAGPMTSSLDGDAIKFYNSAGTVAISSGIDGGGVGYIQSAGGFAIRGDYTHLDLTNQQHMDWTFNQPDGLGNTFTQGAYLTRIRTSGNISYGIGLIGAAAVNGGSFAPYRFIFGYSLDPLNATNNLPADRVEISGGSIALTANLVAFGKLFVGTIAGGQSGKSLAYNETAAAFDLDAPIRSISGAAAVKLSHTGTAGNAFLDWSHNALFLGWNSNPGNQVLVGNGAAGYGPIAASAFNVSSGREHKERIRDLATDGATGRVRARRFRRKGSEREMLGFVAEEVEAAIPEAVVTIPRPPDADGTQRAGTDKLLDPMALLAHLWGEVAELRAELTALKAQQKGA